MTHNLRATGETGELGGAVRTVGRPSIGRAWDREPAKFNMSRIFVWWFLSQCFVYQYLSPIFSINVGINLTPDRVLFLLVLLVFFARKRLPTDAKVPWSTLELSLLAFAIISTLSWAFFSADSVEGRFRWLATLLSLGYQPLVAYYVARRLPYDRSAARTVLIGLAAIGIYLGLTGLFEHYRFLQFLVFPRYILDNTVGVQFGRARGPFAASVVNGGAIIITFLAASAIWPSLTGAKRTWMSLGMATMCLTIYLTQTRGVWLGFGIAIALAFITRTGMRKLAKGLMIAMLLAFISGGAGKFSLFEGTLFSKRSDTVDYRYANYMVALNMFRDNPIFGIGYGNFTHAWRQYFGAAEAEFTRDLTDGNNTTLLAILAEMGIVGISVYLVLLVSAWKICFSAYRQLRPDQDFERMQVIVAFGAFHAFLIMGITTDFRFHELFDSALFYLLGSISNPRLLEMASEKGPQKAEDKVVFRGASALRPA
jgi:O-antigen ligase